MDRMFLLLVLGVAGVALLVALAVVLGMVLARRR